MAVEPTWDELAADARRVVEGHFPTLNVPMYLIVAMLIVEVDDLKRDAAVRATE